MKKACGRADRCHAPSHEDHRKLCYAAFQHVAGGIIK